MLTPKELYESYSINPCSYYSQGTFYYDNGRGSPYDLNRIIRFLKHVKYPCYTAMDTSAIDGTGDKQLALTFKFLQSLDSEAFLEGQPLIESGPAYSVRNSADLTRASYFYANHLTHEWNARMATEYLEHFCGNSLPDCLMMLGPDLVEDSVAYHDRSPSTLGCFYAGAGSRFFCYAPPYVPCERPECPSCVCGAEPIQGCPEDSEDPCCAEGAVFENLCCKVGRSSRLDFSYSIPVDDTGYTPAINNVYFSKSVTNIDQVDSNLEPDIRIAISVNDALVLPDQQVWVLKDSDPLSSRSYVRRYFLMKHLGIIERKDYGGYANFISPSGKNFNTTLDDIFLEYFRKTTQYKCKTISTILDIQTQANNTEIITNTSTMINSIKDLIYNGHGVVLFSNVGFPNVRDSTGLCYPDRIWYQTYSIIGYDDRKLEYPECVYVLSCPFGDWIEGGHPSWGPLPPGCFLVTESHLRCMINFYPGTDFFNCRKMYCNPVLYDCEDPSVKARFEGCWETPEDGKCTPFYCTQQQAAFGILFAMSLSDGFPEQILPHTDFYPVSAVRETLKEQTVYFNANT